MIVRLNNNIEQKALIRKAVTHCLLYDIKLIDGVPSHLPVEILPNVPPVTPPTIEG